MSTSNQPSDDKLYVRRALEASIHIGLAGLLLFWCFKIGRPFIQIIVWGIIIAVAIHPIYSRLKSALGGRDRLAATLITILALIFLLVPTIMLSDSLINTAQEFSAQLDAGTLRVPPPSESVRSWPVIGEPVYKLWSLGSTDLGAAMNKMAPRLKKYGIGLLSTAANAGVGILAFVVSIIIAGVLLANAEGAHQAAVTLFRRLAGEGGGEFRRTRWGNCAKCCPGHSGRRTNPVDPGRAWLSRGRRAWGGALGHTDPACCCSSASPSLGPGPDYLLRVLHRQYDYRSFVRDLECPRQYK